MPSTCHMLDFSYRYGTTNTAEAGGFCGDSSAFRVTNGIPDHRPYDLKKTALPGSFTCQGENRLYLPFPIETGACQTDGRLSYPVDAFVLVGKNQRQYVPDLRPSGCSVWSQGDLKGLLLSLGVSNENPKLDEATAKELEAVATTRTWESADTRALAQAIASGDGTALKNLMERPTTVEAEIATNRGGASLPGNAALKIPTSWASIQNESIRSLAKQLTFHHRLLVADDLRRLPEHIKDEQTRGELGYLILVAARTSLKGAAELEMGRLSTHTTSPQKREANECMKVLIDRFETNGKMKIPVWSNELSLVINGTEEAPGLLRNLVFTRDAYMAIMATNPSRLDLLMIWSMTKGYRSEILWGQIASKMVGRKLGVVSKPNRGVDYALSSDRQNALLHNPHTDSLERR